MTHVRQALVAAAALCTFGPPLPAAAGTQTGQVTKLQTRARDNLVYFYLTGTATDRPACATQPYWMIKDETSETGKRQFAMLMAAYVSGRSVTIHGAGTCARWSDGEDVDSVILP
jgi:hypothetical protein